MAALAGHVLVRVSTAAVGNAGLGRLRDVAPDHFVAFPAHRLGEGRLRVVVLAGRVDGVLGLDNLPGNVLLNQGVLIDLSSPALETGLAPRSAQGGEIAAKPRLAGR